jgi:hypothetical protein
VITCDAMRASVALSNSLKRRGGGEVVMLST